MEDKILVYILDDDPEMGQLLSLVMKRWQIEAISFTQAQAFLYKVAQLKPALCLIDLNLDDHFDGLQHIAEVRRVCGDDLPILAFSSDSTRAAVTRAIQAGASDYLTKPIEKKVLLAKLSRYIVSDALAQQKEPILPLPDGAFPIQFFIEGEVQRVDESGILITMPHLPRKGSTFYLDESFAKQISGIEKPVLLTIGSTESDPGGGGYRVYAEFESASMEFVNGVRHWLLKLAP